MERASNFKKGLTFYGKKFQFLLCPNYRSIDNETNLKNVFTFATGKNINTMRTKVDRYKKVSAKWWYDNHTGKWIHDDRMGFVLLGKPSGGSKLPSAFKNNKTGNRTY